MTFELSKNFKWVIRDDGAFVYSPKDMSVKVINQTGATIISLCTTHDSESVALQVATEYGCVHDLAQVRQDVKDFLAEMTEGGYLCRR